MYSVSVSDAPVVALEFDTSMLKSYMNMIHNYLSG